MKHLKLFLTTALLLLLCGQTWADYCVAHNGKLSTNSWNASAEPMTDNGDGTYSRTYTNVSAATIQFKITDGSWSNSWNAYSNSKSNVTLSESGGNIQFTLTEDAESVVITYEPSNSNKAFVQVTYPSPDPNALPANLLDVLRGEKVMCYVCNDWNSGSMYVSSNSGHPNDIVNNASTASATFVMGGTSASLKYVVLAASAARYYISNSSAWDGVRMASGTTTVGGEAYNLTNKATFGGATSNHIDVLPSLSTPVWTNQTTAIAEGTTTCDIAASVAAKSVASFTQSVSYYLQNGTEYSAIDLTHLGDLAIGEYTIWAVTYDGKIYVRSVDAATLTVQSAAANTHQISYTALATGWTYGTKPSSAEEDATVEFVVTPAEGYDVVVKLGETTLTPAADGVTYSFTMPHEAVQVSVEATPRTYSIHYPAAPANYTLGAANPIQGATDATVEFSVEPTVGYAVNVTSEQVTLTQNGTTYSFTMPASEVTIAVEAVAVTTLYLINENDWATPTAYVWKDGGDKLSNWPGSSMTATADQYAAHAIYAISFVPNTYDKIIFSNNGANQTGNLTINSAKPYYYMGEWWESLEAIEAAAEELALQTDVTIKGSWDSWNAATHFVLVAVGSEEATATLNLTEKKDYTFKLIEGTSYTGKDNTTLTRAANSMTLADKGQGDNIHLTVDQAGDYVFTYNLTSRALTVAYPDLDPAVDFVGLADKVELNTPVTFAAEAVAMTNPVYTYYVKQGEGEYAQVANPYTFTAVGAYTVKVVANGDNDKSAFAEKAITVAELKTLYFINDKEWAQVNTHMWEGAATATTWPGSVMTNSGNTVRELPIYTVSFEEGDYGKIIFSNDGANQTANQTIDLAKPYFYDGVWYASLAEIEAAIDQAIAEAALRTEFFLVGTFNNWNTTSDRFMKPVADATMAYATITVAEATTYSEINFKLQESGNWRGINDNTTTSRFDKKVEVVKSEDDGNKMYFTPDMAGDYVVALNLETREVSVNYPAKQFYLPGTIGGENWTITANPMDLETASITFSDLAKGVYSFRWTDGTDWLDSDIDTECSEEDVALNGNNVKICVMEGGSVTVTVTEKGQLCVTGDIADIDVVDPITVYSVVGEPAVVFGTAWCVTCNDMEAVGDGTYQLIINQVELTEATTISYKVIGNHSYERFEHAAENAWKYIAEAGVYDLIFTYDPATNEAAVEANVIYTRDVTLGRIGTICLSKDVKEVSGAVFYELEYMEMNGTTPMFIHFVEAEELVGGHAYIFDPTDAQIVCKLADQDSKELVTTEGLVGTYEAIQDGAVGAAGNVLEGNYVISANKFYRCKGNCSLAANRAYISADNVLTEAPAAPAPASRRRIVLGGASVENATALENMTMNEDATKVLINGTIYILRDGAVYSVQGQLVK